MSDQSVAISIVKILTSALPSLMLCKVLFSLRKLLVTRHSLRICSSLGGTWSRCFFSAAINGITGLIIKYLGPQFSRLRPQLYLVIFACAICWPLLFKVGSLTLCDASEGFRTLTGRLKALFGILAIGGAMAALALENHKASLTGTHIMVSPFMSRTVQLVWGSRCQ